MSSTAVKGQVKGLLKGLRYISQMFDEGEDKDIQIGFPTDVKHLAHIGCDDSATNAPSWMTEFKGAPEPSSGAVNSTMPTEDNNGKVDGSRRHSRRSKQHNHSAESHSDSPSRELSSEGSVSKHTRRHHRSSDSSESSRRHRHHSNNGSGTEEEKVSSSSSSKHSHRRKSKTSTSEDKEGSIRRPSRTSRRASKEDSLTDTEVS